MTATDLRSLAETAAFFGVSHPTLKRWLDAGAPIAERGSNGVPYQLSLQALAEWRRGQKDAETEEAAQKAERNNQLRLELLGGAALTGAGQLEVALSPVQRAAALAEEVSRTRLAQLRRELVPAEDMALALGVVLAELKTRLRQIADVAAPELGLAEAQQARLAEIVDEALGDCADRLAEVMSDAAPPP